MQKYNPYSIYYRILKIKSDDIKEKDKIVESENNLVDFLYKTNVKAPVV